MCGIAGWIDCRRLCDSAAIMRRMAQTMVPRGPDSGGFYTDDNCALAHRRLSVIDPARSAQPMTRKTALDSYTIVYNGELYNTAEIRSELESTGNFRRFPFPIPPPFLALRHCRRRLAGRPARRL